VAQTEEQVFIIFQTMVHCPTEEIHILFGSEQIKVQLKYTKLRMIFLHYKAQHPIHIVLELGMIIKLFMIELQALHKFI